MAFEALQLMGAGDVPGAALAHAQAAELAQEAAEVREAQANRARLAENAEALAVANRAAGDPLGNIHQAQAVMAERQDEVAELTEKLRKAEGRLASARSSVQFWADRMLLVDESTQRSRQLSPVEAASARAADQLRRVREGRMEVEQARRSLEQRYAGWCRERPLRACPG